MVTSRVGILPNFSPLGIKGLEKSGRPYRKKPSTVYLLEMEYPFTVETREGKMRGEAGDFAAYDPITGDGWIIRRAYFEQHYEPVMES
jgi:hypothetical protein